MNSAIDADFYIAGNQALALAKYLANASAVIFINGWSGRICRYKQAGAPELGSNK